MKSLLMGCVAMCLSASVLAQAPVKNATVEEMVNQLAPAPGAATATTRSLRNIVPQVRQIDLVVNFDFDSAKLQSASRPLLENLALAMNNDRLKSTRFKVEGHTDAKGSAKYNDELSSRRAQAVVEFLSSLGVQSERLQSEGKGFSQLLKPQQPEAAENRRVRIVAID